MGLVLVDGALVLNNPINELISEAVRLDKTRKFGCIVSIGTGITDVTPLKEKNIKLHQIAKTCAEISICCDKVAEEFARSPHGAELLKSKRYFRFDVFKQLDKVDLEDWQRLDDIQAYVYKYLRRQDIASDMDSCANSLC